ncbi:hypothetical protein OEZ86_001977 [Tetradesmus obliquus]|nr:hypothetical protein OEZ86_001977 [Tetradesmus obliquus]
MGDGKACCPAGSKLCCSVPSSVDIAASGLKCRFGSVDVPAMLCGDTVCCAPPQLADAEDLCYSVLDGNDALLFAYPNCEASTAAAGPQQDAGKCCAPAKSKGDMVSLQDGLQETAAAASAAAGSTHGKTPDTPDFGRHENESRKEYLKREYSALKPFVIISLSYLLFTTTDGAVRMIVLLHAYHLGFTAWQTAVMFTLYEVAGVVTNLLAGLMGARWGIKSTLLTGLTLQLCGIGMLFGWQDAWAANGEVTKGIVFVTAAQMLCGVAKDLTKLGGKTVTKLVTPDERESRLFKVVSFITGFKNSMKGVGYFIGAAALTFNYYFALGILLLLVLAAMPWAVVGLSNQLGRARKENIKLSVLFKQAYNVNVLSVARFFLFGSRDMWFEVPLPFFLRDAVHGFGWERVAVGAVLAGFIIMYGQVQSWTPQLVLQPLKQSPANKYVELLWNGLLCVAPAFLAVMFLCTPIFVERQLQAMAGVLLPGLLLYCVLFAVNSSVHSFLIVKYADGNKVAMNVGFYYMANAMGRLTGTLVSGALYTFGGSSVVYGLGWCFVASVGFAAASTAVTVLLRDDSGGLRCGSKLTLVQ